MKKLIALLLAAVMLLSLCACGSPRAAKVPVGDVPPLQEQEGHTDAMEDKNDETPIVRTEPVDGIYKIGDTFVTEDGMVEFTLDNFCFSDSYDQLTYLPASDGGDIILPSTEVHTFMLFSGTLNLVGNIESSYAYSMYDLELECSNGKKYTGHETCAFELDSSVPYGNYEAEFYPQEGAKTKEIRGVMEIHKEVESDTASSLLLTFTIEGRNRSSGDRTKTEVTVQLR